MNRHRPLYGFSAALLVLGLVLLGGCGTGKGNAADAEKENAPDMLQEYASGLVSGYDRAKATGTEGDMKAIGTALAAYQLDNDGYPSVSGIDALMQELSPDYLRIAAAQDKWGHPFEYSSSATGYKLVSIGHDGIKGTEDDLVFEDGRMTQRPPGSGPSF